MSSANDPWGRTCKRVHCRSVEGGPYRRDAGRLQNMHSTVTKVEHYRR